MCRPHDTKHEEVIVMLPHVKEPDVQDKVTPEAPPPVILPVALNVPVTDK